MANEKYDLDEDAIPVFLINGFLEAGKTDFIKYTMQQEYFQTEGKTLLICCEEGDTDYEPEMLKQYHTDIVYLEDIRELNRQRLDELEVVHNPERIIIEWNGMWNQDELFEGPMSEAAIAREQGREPAYEVSLPENWVVYQVITILDGSTLELYLNNMKGLLGGMLRNAELAIVNRCDDIEDEKLVDFRRKIRAMGRNAIIVLEDKNGEIPQDMLEEDLPYDLNAEVIQIKPEDYGIWFMDCMDNPERYEGKTVEFTAMVLKRRQMPEDVFIPGRMAMTCCEADMTFLGFICHSPEAKALTTKDWVKVRAEVAVEYQKDYQGEGPVLMAKSIARTGAIEDVVAF